MSLHFLFCVVSFLVSLFPFVGLHLLVRKPLLCAICAAYC